MVYIQKNSPLKQLDDNAQKRAMKKEDKAWKRSKRQEHVIAKQEHKEANPKNQKKKAIQDIRTNYKIQKLQGKLNSPLTQRVKGPWPDDTGDKLMKGIGKVGDAIKSGIVSYGKHVLSGGSIGKSIRHLKDNYYQQFNTKDEAQAVPDLPTRPPQKMGMMIKKIRKIPISTTPELQQPTEKPTMGLLNPPPPKKNTSELKVLTGTDLSKHKRKLI